jgi:hypothetical protein
MRTIDQLIIAKAASIGIKPTADEVRTIRLQVESAYLDSILDGVTPFSTTKQGDSDATRSRTDGKEKRDLSRQNPDDGQAELHG